MPDPLQAPPRRIAVFRALQLGDMLCAVPALRALRAAWPQARITLIGLPWAEQFVARYAHLDDLLPFPGHPGMPEREPDLPALPGFLAAVQARRFDLVLQLHGSGIVTNPLIATFGARLAAGHVLDGAWHPTPGVFMPWRDQTPEIERMLALVEALGAPSRGDRLELPILPGERLEWERLKPELPHAARGLVCVHPGARLATRRWPAARFARVADRLAMRGYGVVLTGTAGESRLLEETRSHMRGPALSLAGRTSLGALAALVAHARLVVSNDTGMSHVAAAVGTPSVVIASGSDPCRWRPRDAIRHRVVWHPVPCRPCAHPICPTGHECALGVGVEDVLVHATELLARDEEAHHVAG